MAYIMVQYKFGTSLILSLSYFLKELTLIFFKNTRVNTIFLKNKTKNPNCPLFSISGVNWQ